MKNERPFTTRQEKVAFLAGLKDGTRTLSEITEPPVIFLQYRDDRPDEVLNELTGELLTLEQAEVIKNKKYVDTIVWVQELTGLDKDF